MKASIIIPSYNASERLYLNLVSLKYQDYPHEDFEVVVVDNGSKDDTAEMLSNFKGNYPLKIVRLDENKGIARGRNKGILVATGDILIFHDSDMIAPKDFVRKHIKGHEKENIILCGLPWLRVYSYFYKNFSMPQIRDFYRHENRYNFDVENLQIDKHQLINEEQIRNGSFVHSAFDLDSDFIASLKETIMIYGIDLKDYYLPWRFFITNNVSVERKKVIAAGMFDEKIIKYGFEDYDLGFRLFKAGINYKLSYNIISYHQEHPKNSPPEEIIENVNYMFEKYNNIYFVDMLLFCISYAVSLDSKSINGIAADINRMYTMNQYNEILTIFLKLLKEKANMSYKLNKDSNLISANDINFDKVKKALKELRETEKIFYFPGIFSALIKNIFSIDL